MRANSFYRTISKMSSFFSTKNSFFQLRFLSIILFWLLVLFFNYTLQAQSKTKTKVKNPKESPDISKQLRNLTVDLTLKEIIQRLVDKNVLVQNSKQEYAKVDTELMKNDSKYAWKLLGEIQTYKAKLPVNSLNLVSGNKQQQDKISVGIEKMFQTGTYFKIEASTIRFDTNAFESSSSSNSVLSIMSAPPLYTGAISLTLSQEILKYSFGKTEKNLEKMLQLQSLGRQDVIIFNLTGLVVQTFVDYWTLAMLDSSISTTEKILRNTRNIRNLTYKKQSIGLSEKFELNQWNGIVYQLESQIEKSKLDRELLQNKLNRSLHLDSGTKIGKIGDMVDALPKDLDLEKDTQYALDNRLDLKNIKKQKEVAKLGLSNAEDEDMPSLKISGVYSTRGQSFISPQENLYDYNYGILSGKYPEVRAKIELSYPLWDQGIKSNIRDAHVQIKQLEIQEANLRREIIDEMKIRFDSILSSYDILKNAIRIEKETSTFYNSVYNQFVIGRVSAIIVKNALDAYSQAQLGAMQAKINYNINLLRYDLTKNYIFEKYGIEIYQILEEARKKHGKQRS